MSGLAKGLSILSRILDMFPTPEQRSTNQYMKKRKELQDRLARRKEESAKIFNSLTDTNRVQSKDSK